MEPASLRDTVQGQALLRAVQLFGSVQAVAEKVGVPPFVVRAWVAGEMRIPPLVFLHVIDLLNEHDSGSLR